MSRFSHIRTIYYRGSLDSCNYTCSYCAFGRKGQQGPNLSHEVKALEGLYDQIAKDFTYPLRIMLIPYGEGMIHPWFRQQMIRLAALPQVEGISCQTNLSFPVDTFLKEIRTAGVSPDKIKCWCSFHPEMVKVEDFVRKTEMLLAGEIEICVGTVGDPSKKEILRQLRNELPLNVYMFINAMEGKKITLSKREIAFFSAIDNLFPYDRSRVAADWEACRGGKESMYVDFRGDIYPCPRSRARMGNLYEDPYRQPDHCGRSVCDCYISYSQLRSSAVQRYMENGAVWRIPERKGVKALFFDIDGTLVPANKKIPESYLRALNYFAGQVPLFLATALPVDHAKKRLGKWFDLFSGGVFAGGAHIRYGKDDWYVPVSRPPLLPGSSCRIVCHENQGEVFKYTLTASNKEKADALYESLEASSYQLFRKGRLLTIVDANASKGNGLLMICEQAGIPPAYTLAMGDTVQDLSMIRAAGYGCAVLEAEEELKKEASYLLNPGQLPVFFKVLH